MVSSIDTITFACPACGARLSVPSSMAGVTGPCPTCQGQITAPLSENSAATAAVVTPAPPAQVDAVPVQTSPQGPPQPQSPAEQPPLADSRTAGLPPQSMPAQQPQPQPQHERLGQQLPGNTAMPAASMPTGRPMAATQTPSSLPESRGHAQALPTSGGLRPRPRGMESEDGLTPLRHEPRRRSTAKSTKRGSARKLFVGCLGAAAVIAGGSLAAPELMDFWRTTKAGVPQTANLDGPAPRKPVASNENVAANARIPDDIPLGPADGHLVNNSQPLLVEDKPPAPSANDADELPPMPEVDGILDEPREFLQGYLTSPAWTDLVGMSLSEDLVRPKMAAYYAKHPYQPEKIREITFQHKQPLPDSNYQFYLFKVVTDSNTASFPMTVEETADGLRTDWLSYVQFKDTHLQRFLDNPQVGPDGKGESQTFNVILRRGHDFTDEVPDTENKWCYKIDAPVDDPLMGGFCFIPKFSNYGKELDSKLDWLLLYFPIVELRWEVDKDHPDKPYVRLLKIKQFNWRAHDPDAVDLETIDEAS